MINEFLNYSHLSSVSLQLIWKIIGTLTCSWLMGQGRTLMAIDREEVTRPQWQEGVSQEYPCNCQQMTKQVIYNGTTRATFVTPYCKCGCLLQNWNMTLKQYFRSFNVILYSCCIFKNSQETSLTIWQRTPTKLSILIMSSNAWWAILYLWISQIWHDWQY